MKTYKKQFEDVFTSDRAMRGFDITKLSTRSGQGIQEYIENMDDLLMDYSDFMFNWCVKFEWLRRQLCHNGIPLKSSANGLTADKAFGILARKYTRKDFRYITRKTSFSRIASYMDDLFPDFVKNNPIKNPELYKISFGSVTMDFLVLVSDMDDRLGLLNLAEKEKWGFNQFFDYVINHVYSMNEEIGRVKYTVSVDPLPHIKNKDKTNE